MKVAVALASLSLVAPAVRAQLPPPNQVHPFTADLVIGERCDPTTDWCHENAPLGERVNAVWAASATDAWAVLTRGAALHWDGGVWSFVETGTFATLFAVWGAASDDVWAGGEAGTLLHWDGGSWSQVDAGTARDVVSISGTASQDVWVLLGDGTALHWDGAGFTATSTGGTPVSIFAIAPDDAIAAGNSACQRWNGTAWSATPCGISGSAASVWASAGNDVWVVASGAYHGDTWTSRAHWDGNRWTSEQWYHCDACGYDPGYPGWFETVTGSSSSDAWINGRLHWDGRTWAQSNRPDAKRSFESPDGALFSTDAVHLYLGDAGGVRYTGMTRPIDPLVSARGAAGDVWFVNNDGWVIGWDGGSFRTLSAGSAGVNGSSAFGLASSSAWAGTTDAMAFFDGSRWNPSPLESGAWVTAGWARADDDAVAFGSVGNVLASWHFDGARWTRNTFLFGGDRFWAASGSSGAEFWAVGEHREGSAAPTDAAWHWDQGAWQRYVPSASGAGILSVFSLDSATAWLLEAHTYPVLTRSILAWDGAGFRSIGELSADVIAATSPSDLWVSQTYNSGSTWHWDGARWQDVAVPWSDGVASLWGNAAEMFAVTRGGGVFRRAAR